MSARYGTNALSLAGRQAADEAMRRLLLETLDREGWNLDHAAKALFITDGSALIRYLKELVPVEYARAQAEGKIRKGAPRGTDRRCRFCSQPGHNFTSCSNRGAP